MKVDDGACGEATELGRPATKIKVLEGTAAGTVEKNAAPALRDSSGLRPEGEPMNRILRQTICLSMLVASSGLSPNAFSQKATYQAGLSPFL